MKVRYTDRAKADLTGIGDYIATEDPARALTFIGELRRACTAIADLPLGYPVVEDIEPADIRKRSYRGYLIFYRVASGEIAILHVVHGARSYPALFRAID